MPAAVPVGLQVFAGYFPIVNAISKFRSHSRFRIEQYHFRPGQGHHIKNHRISGQVRQSPAETDNSGSGNGLFSAGTIFPGNHAAFEVLREILRNSLLYALYDRMTIPGHTLQITHMIQASVH